MPLICREDLDPCLNFPPCRTSLSLRSFDIVPGRSSMPRFWHILCPTHAGSSAPHARIQYVVGSRWTNMHIIARTSLLCHLRNDAVDRVCSFHLDVCFVRVVSFVLVRTTWRSMMSGVEGGPHWMVQGSIVKLHTQRWYQSRDRSE